MDEYNELIIVDKIHEFMKSNKAIDKDNTFSKYHVTSSICRGFKEFKVSQNQVEMVFDRMVKADMIKEVGKHSYYLVIDE